MTTKKKTSKKPITNKPIKKKRPLTIKQRKFIDEVVNSWNATQAVKKAGYRYKNTHVAESIGSENMRKPEIKAEIEDRLKVAKDMIYTIATTSEKDEVKLRACQDIVDRVEWRAKQSTDLNVKWELTINDIKAISVTISDEW